MSMTKDWCFQVQEEKMYEWIRSQMNDPDADENSEGWYGYVEYYNTMLEAMEEAYELESDLNWYKNEAYQNIFSNFLKEIAELKALHSTPILDEHLESFYKMVYVHSVTILESYLSDTVKSLIITNDEYLENAISNVNELKKAKFSISDIKSENNGALGFSLKILSKMLYHNISKIVRIVAAIVDKKIEVNFVEVEKIIKIRHDLVHRNGKDEDGNLILINEKDVLTAIDSIRRFVIELNGCW